MSTRSLSHLSDDSVSEGFHSRVARDHTNAADLLEYLGEFDHRDLYARAGYPSMFRYCIDGLHMSDDVALVRIRAARALRDFQALFEAVASGRLHLSAVLLLKPHLTPESVDGWVAAATHKTKAQIELLLAERFPRPDVPILVQSIVSCSQSLTGYQLVPERVGNGQGHAPERVQAPPLAGLVQPPAAAVQPIQPRAKVTPLAPERFALQVTIAQGTHDKLRRAQELLSHSLPASNVADVLDRALDALIRDLEKQKFAATTKPRAKARVSEDPRHIPAHVKRAVLARDGRRCTFVSDSGVRCSSRRFLEFDHIHEVARGGRATVSGIRLLCRTHNQYAAECTFGAGFMDEKRRANAEERSSSKPRQDASAAANEAASVDRTAAERASSPEYFERPSLEATFARTRLEAAFDTPRPAPPSALRGPSG